MNKMNLVKCERCCAETDSCDTIWFALSECSIYPACWKCYHEWYINGYFNIWQTFLRNNNGELADKFLLDYLGKLG